MDFLIDIIKRLNKGLIFIFIGVKINSCGFMFYLNVFDIVRFVLNFALEEFSIMV